jgi:hypothetical protein
MGLLVNFVWIRNHKVQSMCRAWRAGIVEESTRNRRFAVGERSETPGGVAFGTDVLNRLGPRVGTFGIISGPEACINV